jgi:CrcB protein
LPLDPDAVKPGSYKWPLHITPLLISIVFIGGCFGTFARYWVGLQLPASPGGWPAATLAVNLLGAFLLGFLLEGLARLGPDAGARRIVRLGVGTGFIGAFTTYSTFAVDMVLLFRGGNGSVALLYGFVSIAGGLLLSAAGIRAAANHHKSRSAKS